MILCLKWKKKPNQTKQQQVKIKQIVRLCVSFVFINNN